jgi:hypothetical protein
LCDGAHRPGRSSPSGRSAAALHRRRIPCELRSASTEGICYEVKLPLDVHTDTISEALISLKRAATVNVKWEQQKQTK